MGASFCSEQPGEGHFRACKIKRGRVKKSVRGRGGGGGSCHHMGQIRPQLADFIHPSPPTLPIHSSLSQPSPRNNTPARCALMNSTFAPIPQSCLRCRRQSRHTSKTGPCVRTAMLNTPNDEGEKLIFYSLHLHQLSSMSACLQCTCQHPLKKNSIKNM